MAGHLGRRRHRVPLRRYGAGQDPRIPELPCWYGSHVYDTKQMSRLIDAIVRDCKDAGIETLPPDKLGAMMEEWA